MASTDAQALLLKISADVSGMQKQMDKAVGYVDAGSGKMVLRSQQAAAAIEKSFGSVTADGFRTSLSDMAKLQDRLTAAQLAGNKAEARALGEHLALQRQVQKAAVLQLETQLAIAKAAGSTKQIAELQELLAVTREVQRLSAVGLIGTKGLVEAEKAIVSLTAAEKAAEKAGLGLAATRVFDSARLATLEEGSTRLRIFGSALEPLGAAGLAAAAGIAAFALVMERTSKAVEFGAAIGKIALEVGVSTAFIQKFNFAAHQSDIDIGVADQALKRLNETLGSVQGNLPRAKNLAVVFANALKITPEQLRSYKDLGDLFPVLAERIKNAGSAAEQAAIAKKFGAEELLPLLKLGAAGFNELTQKAVDLGIVLDEVTIKKAEEAKKKLSELDDVMKAKANVTFLEFVDTLTAVKTAFLEAETAALRFLAAITGTETAQVKLDEALGAAKNPLYRFLYGDKRLQGNALDAEIANANRNLKIEDAAKAPGLPARQFIPDKTKKGPADQTDNLIKLAEEDEQRSLKALAEAYKALTANANERLGFEIKANNAEAAAEQAKLKGDIDKLLKDKTIDGKESDILQAKIEQAQTNVEKARVAKNDLARRNADWAAEDVADETRKQLRESEIASLQLQANLAVTQAERNRIEDKILFLKQDELRHENAKANSRLQQTGAITDTEGEARGRAFLATQKADRAQQALANETPVQKYLRSIQDLNTEFENASVSAVKNLSDGLANAIVNAQNLGDVASSVFRQLIAQLLSAALQKDIFGPLLAAVGLADGGFVSGPGSATSDSIPARLSDGEYVVNAEATKKHRALLEAINRGATPHFADGGIVGPPTPTLSRLRGLSIPQGGGPVTVIQPFHFHAEGAVLTSELLAQANTSASRYANHAAAVAMTAVRKGWPAQQQSFGLLGTT